MYDQIARYYDLTHDSLTDDIEMVLALARQAQGAVLELGCGTGRLLRPLAQAGIQVTGVDHSEAMLARAAARLLALPDAVRERVALVHGDMTAPPLPAGAEFGLVVLPYNTAMHLTTPQTLKMLRAARQVVGENGRFFLDVINPAAIAQTPNDRALSLEAVLHDDETDEMVLQFASNFLDDAAQKLVITWVYDASPAAGGPVTRTVAEGVYHYRYPHQWEMLLRDSGWRLLEIAGGYGGELFTEESERLLLTAVAA